MSGSRFAAVVSGGGTVIKPVQDGADMLIFLQHHGDGFFLIQRDVAFAFAVRVIGQRLFQFLAPVRDNPPPSRRACP